jgi:predicted transcriptional regulator
VAFLLISGISGQAHCVRCCVPARLPQNKVDLCVLESQNFRVMRKAKRSQDAVLPTPGELRLLRILWRIGEGSIDDILKAADEKPEPNYKTVQTLLRIMERKGQIEHSLKGRAFVFRPLIARNDVHRLSIRDVMKTYFTGSRTELLVELLHDERIPPKELRELENLIRERRKEQMKG